MENKNTSTTTISNPNNVVSNINNENDLVDMSVPNHSFAKKLPPSGGDKKRGGGFHLIRAALFMLRPKGKKPKSLEIEVASKGMFHKMVGSMRPLHLQNDDQSPPHSAAITKSASLPTMEHFEDFIPQSSPVSPLMAYSPFYSTSSTTDEGSTSRYASALNLNELDQSEVEDEDDEDHNNNINNNDKDDQLIDSKAEEFIAQFYQQMKLQNHIEKARRANKHHHGQI